ncbi:hypothetical protein RFI_30437 [Reticulomyxa filosa]|uniref:TLDc domain-containing protein n=1 Tax=Reticulomyxa filosa TaxID=46433 RepID=X6LYG6_RETFI|nr:hypothetical protein RFI_30437 [Reticulomyxa filosa]|eukprot:ETO06953.1 hypothetical protein RFI_30437 [Reticulomyxa filosa]
MQKIGTYCELITQHIRLYCQKVKQGLVLPIQGELHNRQAVETYGKKYTYPNITAEGLNFMVDEVERVLREHLKITAHERIILVAKLTVASEPSVLVQWTITNKVNIVSRYQLEIMQCSNADNNDSKSGDNKNSDNKSSSEVWNKIEEIEVVPTANNGTILLYNKKELTWGNTYKIRMLGCCESKKGKTIVIVETQNCIFGGYTTLPWSTRRTEKTCSSDKTAFLFSLKNESGVNPKSFPIKSGHEKEAIVVGSDGPCFGKKKKPQYFIIFLSYFASLIGIGDIVIKNNFNESIENSSILQSYEGPSHALITGQFRVSNIEKKLLFLKLMYIFFSLNILFQPTA